MPHPRALVLALPILLSACGARAPRLPSRVIDVHTHASFTSDPDPGDDIPYTRERLLQEWDAAGVVGAVVHLPQGSVAPPDLPGPVRACAGIGPEPDREALEAALRSGAVSCMKVYLGYVHLYPSDPAYDVVYELAERYGVPVVFHTGDTSSSRAKLKYADPLGVDEVAVDHPQVTFVIAHCGNPWLPSAAEVAYKNPNVYIECSALLTGDMDALPPDMVERYVTDAVSYVLGYVERPEKLMFGSDWPLVDLRSYVRAYAAAVPEEHWRLVFHDNAARVFGLGEQRTGGADPGGR